MRDAIPVIATTMISASSKVDIVINPLVPHNTLILFCLFKSFFKFLAIYSFLTTATLGLKKLICSLRKVVFSQPLRPITSNSFEYFRITSKVISR
jgi:hypothetical protein